MGPEEAVRFDRDATKVAAGKPAGVAAYTRWSAREGHIDLERPFLPGTSLRDALASGPLPVPRALHIAIELLEALRHLHDAHALHRRVHPGNVLLTGRADRPSVVLLDAVLELLPPGLEEAPTDAHRYAAPEAAGILRTPVGPTADLFSAGLVLRHCLTGRAPRPADTLPALLDQQQNDTLAHLRTQGLDVPRALDEILQRLHARDPRQRYATAGAALSDLRALAGALAEGHPDPDLVVGARDTRDLLTDPGFIGRHADLEAFDGPLRAAATGHAGLLLVGAESGMGKTRLLAEAAFRAAPHGVRVFHGQGADRVAPAPYQILTGVFQDALDAADADPDYRDHLRTSLREHAAALAAACPPVRDLYPETDIHDLGREEHGETRTRQAILAFLDALGQPGRPALVLLDDAQWADDATLRTVDAWVRRPRSPDEAPRHDLLVAAYRTEEVGPDHPLQRLPSQLPRIHLRPFDLDQTRRMAESMAGPLPRQVPDLLHRLAQGNPFLVEAGLRGLVEGGALRPHPDGWRVHEPSLHEAQSSRHAIDFLQRRLQHLPEDAHQLLRVAALLGKRFPLAQAAGLAGLDAETAYPAIQDALRRRILWPTEDADAFAFAHDKLREGLLDELDGPMRSALHLRAAEVLEAEAPDRAFELAYHFDQAGQAARAFPHALQAAEAARAAFNLSVAETYYRIAQRGCPDDAAALTCVATGLGDVLMLEGRYADAQPWFETACERAPDVVARARARGKVGELAVKRGDVAAAGVAFEDALRTLGRHIPRHRVTLVLCVLWEVLVQFVHVVLPRWTTGRRDPGAAPEKVLAVHLYNRMAYAYWFARGALPTGWTHMRGLNLGERFRPTPELAQAYSEHAPAITIVPWFTRGIEYGRRSLELRKGFQDEWGQGQSLAFLGTVLYSASRYHEALQHLHDGARILDRTGDRWEANTARWHIALCLYRLGDLAEAARVAHRVADDTAALDDRQGRGIALGIHARARLGDVDARELLAARERASDDGHTFAEASTGLALHHLHHGRPHEAMRTLQEAYAMIRAKGMRQEYVAPLRPWIASAHRAVAEAAPVWDASRRRAAARRALRSARAAVRHSRAYRNNLPHALREAGLAHSLLGHPRRARHALLRAHRLATAQNAAYEALQTQVAIEILRDGEPNPSTQEALERARAPRIAEGAPAPRATLSLAERFTGLLDAGRRLAGAMSRDEIRTEACGALQRLLRAQRAHWIDLDATRSAQAPPEDASAALADVIDRALVSPDSVTAHGVGGTTSILGIAVHAAGHPAAVLLALHDGLPDLFGSEESRMAAFVASLAEAALHRAQGVDELRGAHHELRVQKSILEAQAEAAADGILVVDPQGRIVSHNGRFAHMWRIPEDVLARRDDAAAIRAVIDRLAEPEAFLARIRYLYEHPNEQSRDEIPLVDGRIFDRFSGPITLDDGSVAGRVWYFRDVSDERRHERELRAANARLREADRFKTEFINTAAHELNTPLTPLALQMHMLKSPTLGRLSPDQSRAIDVIDRNLGRLTHLVKDVLDGARLQAGRLRIERQPCDLATLVGESADVFRLQAVERRVTLDLRGPDTVPVQADPDRVAQVLINLLSNAIKYTPPGGRITVDVTATVADATVHVRDTGLGLTPDQRARLFQPFTQVHGPAAGQAEGTGLGLFISRGIVEAHGGRMECTSAGPGKGSTFWFTIPVRPTG